MAKQKNGAAKKSKYAQKLKRPMMYGPGCCGHKLTAERAHQIRVENETAHVSKRGHYE